MNTDRVFMFQNSVLLYPDPVSDRIQFAEHAVVESVPWIDARLLSRVVRDLNSTLAKHTPDPPASCWCCGAQTFDAEEVRRCIDGFE